MLPSSRPYVRSALSKRGLDQIKAAGVERRRRLEIHLVGGDFHHLVFEIHGIAGRAHFESARIGIPVSRLAQANALDMALRSTRERNGRKRAWIWRAGFIERQQRKIACVEVWVEGIGHDWRRGRV